MTKPFLVGITGGTASGKTFVVEALKDKFDGRILIISEDQYYKSSDATKKTRWERANMDSPDAFDNILFCRHLKKLVDGETVWAPTYDYKSQHRTDVKIELTPKAVIVVEGILCLCDPKIRQLMNKKIYLQADGDIRLARRLLRDISERGVSMTNLRENIEWYLNVVKPMHNKYVSPMKKYADLIFSTNHGSLEAAAAVSEIVEKELEKRLPLE